MSNNKMLIDATHPEETRVVVLRNNRVEEFDYESAARKLLRGNIYLAKVTRVEPSLQAAFVDYGGNRHGFLAFNEIHPDYYQIPMADRQALLEEEAAAEAREEQEADARAERLARRQRRRKPRRSREQDANQTTDDLSDQPTDEDDTDDGVVEIIETDADDEAPEEIGQVDDVDAAEDDDEGTTEDVDNDNDPSEPATVAERTIAADDTLTEEVPKTSAGVEDNDDQPEPESEDGEQTVSASQEADDEDGPQDGDTDVAENASDEKAESEETLETAKTAPDTDPDDGEQASDKDEAAANKETDPVDQVGSEDALEELAYRPRRRLRSYKIQEVIKRRQIILVQVVKEERGTKGAALTTYLSLAGRYTVLMPNTARGGGISRKITNPQDRKRLKAVAADLEVPEGMGLIIRTAGAARTKQEIKRDFEYLLRLWESVRELTLQSTAPSLVYEEGNLIKRSIRDLYDKDIEQIVVAGSGAHKEAREFMRMLMPSHARNVVLHSDPEPLFTRYGIERQLNAMFSPYVTLRSGGYLVINQTEALVAVDVNSGKATREFSIEETALQTNLEAADEIARQLKLRDLAGLIVIDFIDMEEKRNNRAVERRLKESLRLDRARIQLGRISHFGLMEMSRQRLRTGVLEGSTSQCPHCQGTGIIRSTESVALAVIRGLEDALMQGTRTSLIAMTTNQVALYILNNKRQFINAMESHFGVPISIQASDKLQGANFTIERGHTPSQPVRRAENTAVNMDWGFDGDSAQGGGLESDSSLGDTVNGEREGRDERGSRRRRRGRRGSGQGQQSTEGGSRQRGTRRRRSQQDMEAGPLDPADHLDPDDVVNVEGFTEAAVSGDVGFAEDMGEDTDGERTGRRRRRGRRGGRRGRGRNKEQTVTEVSVTHFTEEIIDDFGGAVMPDEFLSDDMPSLHSTTEQTEDAPTASMSESSDERNGGADPMTASEEASDREDSDIPEATPAEVEADAEPVAEEPAAPPRRSLLSSKEPKLERVVVGSNATSEEDDAGSPPAPKRGWWQKRMGG